MMKQLPSSHDRENRHSLLSRRELTRETCIMYRWPTAKCDVAKTFFGCLIKNHNFLSPTWEKVIGSILLFRQIWAAQYKEDLKTVARLREGVVATREQRLNGVRLNISRYKQKRYSRYCWSICTPCFPMSWSLTPFTNAGSLPPRTHRC